MKSYEEEIEEEIEYKVSTIERLINKEQLIIDEAQERIFQLEVQLQGIDDEYY